MKTLKYFGIIFLLISLQLFAQEYNCITASIQQVAAQNRGRWLPSEGTINALIVFAEFPDDNYDINNTKWVKGNAPQNMSNWIDQTSPTQGSLTHYFNEMSGNKLHLIGKVVHVVAPHTRDWYLSNYTTNRRGNIHKEIIQQLDSTWNFAEFDNWDFVTDYTHDNIADTYVDMIIFVWRNIEKDYPEAQRNTILTNLNFTSNFGDLGYAGTEFNVDSGLRKIRMDYGGYSSIPLGSGVTVRNYLTEDPFKNAVHEFSHYLIGDNSYHNGFGFWGMVSAWGTRSYIANAFERYRLGWVADSTTYTISNSTQTLTNRTLSDFVTGRNAYRFVINSSPQEYFFIENHQKTSYWENNAPFWGSQSGTVENGIYVIRNVGAPSYSDPYSWLQLISADGRFNWEVNQSTTNPWGSGQLPVFKQLAPNRDSGYHDNQWIPFSYGGLPSPDAIHYTEQNGIPVQDVRFQGDGKDAFRIGYNQVFSPWSNPNNQRTTSQTTPFGFEITNFSNGVYTLNIYVNTSQNASPSKPQNIRTSGLNSEPTISWDANAEQDISSYKVYRSVNDGLYQLIADNVTTTSITDNLNSIIGTLQNVKYKVQAKDNQNLLSVFSEPCTLVFTGFRNQMNMLASLPISYTGNQQGAASVKMLLNYVNQATTATVQEIYSQSGATAAMNAENVKTALQYYTPNSVQIPNNYTWDTFSNSDRNTVLNPIIKWVAYNYTNSTKPHIPNYVAGLVPFNSSFNDWVAVSGCYLSNDPWSGGNNYDATGMIVYGLWVTRPNGGGMGIGDNYYNINVFNTYFLPIGGQYYGVVDPPTETYPLVYGEPIKLNLTNKSNILQELSTNLLPKLNKHKKFVEIFESIKFYEETIVTNLSTKGSYTIINIGKNKKTEAGIVIDNITSELLEVNVPPAPVDYFILTSEAAKNILSKSITINKDDLKASVSKLVYIKEYCSNLYYPLWEIAVNDKKYYVSQDEKIIDVKLKETPSVNNKNEEGSVILQNYPNPFNPTTSISYQLPEAVHVTLKVYDLLGREVASLVNETKQAGRYNVTFDAGKLASGIYIYILQAGNYFESKKMLLTK